MNKLYLFAPQWQDSGLTNELYGGAFALKRYFESLCDPGFREIAVEPDGEQITEHNIRWYNVIKRQLAEMAAVIRAAGPERIFTLGGGCGIAVPIISYLSARYPGLRVFWFDAHGDLNSPETTPSMNFHGMPLRFVTEKQNNGIGEMFNIISPKQLCLIGSRDLDPPELEYAERNGIVSIGIDAETGNRIEQVLRPGEPAYVHVDVDVLDPSEYDSVKCPVKNGFKIAELKRCLELVMKKQTAVAMSIVESAETNTGKIKRLKDILELGIGF